MKHNTIQHDLKRDKPNKAKLRSRQEEEEGGEGGEGEEESAEGGEGRGRAEI